jgi:hypothetical protein
MTSTELQAWLATPIDWEAFEEVTIALLPNDRGEVQRKDASPYPRPRSAEETTAAAGQEAREG